MLSMLEVHWIARSQQAVRRRGEDCKAWKINERRRSEELQETASVQLHTGELVLRERSAHEPARLQDERERPALHQSAGRADDKSQKDYAQPVRVAEYGWNEAEAHLPADTLRGWSGRCRMEFEQCSIWSLISLTICVSSSIELPIVIEVTIGILSWNSEIS